MHDTWRAKISDAIFNLCSRCVFGEKLRIYQLRKIRNISPGILRCDIQHFYYLIPRKSTSSKACFSPLYKSVHSAIFLQNNFAFYIKTLYIYFYSAHAFTIQYSMRLPLKYYSAGL